jgi:predicted ATPase
MIATYLEKIARSGAILIIATHESPELARIADQEIILEST